MRISNRTRILLFGSQRPALDSNRSATGNEPCMLAGDSRAVWWAGMQDVTFPCPPGSTPSHQAALLLAVTMVR